MRFTTGGSDNDINCKRIGVGTWGSRSHVEAAGAGVDNGSIKGWSGGRDYCRRVGRRTSWTWGGVGGGGNQGLNGGGDVSGGTNGRDIWC